MIVQSKKLQRGQGLYAPVRSQSRRQISKRQVLLKISL